MKRLALAVAVIALAACTTKKDEPAMTDTATPAMAPAPADTGMMRDTGMMHDSAMMKDSSKRP